ncbi:MAG: TraR/DksA family transcriptional regulator [Victivallales bacterium]|nr:TraR/DksA family transcriptional regulator [Victivallales bacterium]
MTSKKSSTAKSKFSPEFISGMHDKLLSERNRIMARYQQARSNLQNNSKGENVEETGSEDFIHAADLSMLGADSEQLAMIDSALANIARGKYGICADCGEAISEARLTARPFARYCIKCKSIREERGEFNGRR